MCHQYLTGSLLNMLDALKSFSVIIICLYNFTQLRYVALFIFCITYFLLLILLENFVWHSMGVFQYMVSYISGSNLNWG